jgi:prepilin-type N-terminal cleavage/methylation domain-containing protein
MMPSRSRAGFSLVELAIALTVMGVVMAALMGSVVSIQRGYVNQRERVKAQESLRAAQMTVITILRSAGADPLETGAGGLNPDPDGDGVFDEVRVTADFNPVDGDFADALEDVRVWQANDTLWVRWQTGAVAQALAAPVSSIRFQYYANNGAEVTDPDEVVGATRAKFVLEAPRDSRTGSLERLESWWIHLRNRS